MFDKAWPQMNRVRPCYVHEILHNILNHGYSIHKKYNIIHGHWIFSLLPQNIFLENNHILSKVEQHNTSKLHQMNIKQDFQTDRALPLEEACEVVPVELKWVCVLCEGGGGQ